MGLFESIKKRLGDKPLNYLWELKVTDDEYVQLKQLLAKHALSKNRNINRFITICKECTLFVAEYWRREYVDGAHSWNLVVNAFNSNIFVQDVIDEFAEASKRGLKILKLEILESDKGQEFLDSMLYQGGLPMKLVTENITNSKWDRFTRGLVNRKINFEELDLGKLASQSKSLRAYCEQLIYGIESDRHLHMPFFCQNENDFWFMYLKKLAKQEKTRRRQLHPFSLAFEFRVDTIENQIYTKYIVKGLQSLPMPFLEEHGINDTNFFSVQVRRNGLAVDTFDYTNKFCRYPVLSKHPYQVGDYISVFIHNQENAYIGDCLDMSVPHLLFRNKDNKYELGNRMGKQDSIILFTEDWVIQTETNLEKREYSWGTNKLVGLHIPADFTDELVLKGNDGCITFSMNAQLYWTEMLSHPLYEPNIFEPLYDANRCVYTLCYDTEDGTMSRRSKVQYRNKWQDNWTETPSFGEIFVRAIDTNGHYVTPTRFINIGDGLSVCLKKADKKSCQIKVVWPHGHVSTLEGERKIDDLWEIKKDNCQDPRKIRFTLTPNENGINKFDISIKAPFKDFSIKNIYGDDIENDCWIPYSDVDKYQYHLVGQNVREYTYGNIRRGIRWNDERLYIMDNGRTLKKIPYEGSLMTLFDSREILRSMLEQTSQNMLNAEIKVQFTLEDGQKIKFSIKESPFRPRQISDGRIEIIGNNNTPVKFTGVLKLLKLDEPNLAPKEIFFDENSGFYTIPEEIRSWGKTILFGRTRGRICPALVDLTNEMDASYRANNRESSIATIKEKLQDSHLGDDIWTRTIDWFNKTQENDIPASSILELYCTSQNYKALLSLVFQLYIKCVNEDERDILRERLKSFSNDLAFQWYWLRSHLSELLNQLNGFMQDPTTPTMQEIYIKWAMNHEIDDRNKYLSALKEEEEYLDHIVQCITEVSAKFTEWIKDLCIYSMVESYGSISQGIAYEIAETIINCPQNIHRVETSDNNYIELNQDSIGDDIDSFFHSYRDEGRPRNEQWLYSRVKATVAHLNGKIDLFAQKGEIRRSIIFCSKSCNIQFIIALNNALCAR